MSGGAVDHQRTSDSAVEHDGQVLPHQRDVGHGLGQRAVRAGAWNLVLNIATGALSLVRVVVLARLLSPGDFGVFSIALVTIAAFDAFTQTGFDSALIQKKSDILDYLDTVWVVQIVRGILIALSLFIIAKPVAIFFDEPAATSLLRLVAIVPLLKGFENVGTVFLSRELEFNKQFQLSLSEALLDIIVSVGVALLWRDALALIVGLAAGRAARLVVSYRVHDYRPRLRLDISKMRELHRYGRWVFLNNILYFIALRGDKAVVGKLLGPVLLGAYELGFRISEVVTRSLLSVIGEVAFPAYSKIQDQRDRLQRAYLMVLESVAPIVIPAGMMLSALAQPLVRTVFGPDWAPIADVLPFLAWAGVIRSIAGTGGSLYLAVGKPSRDFTMNFLRVVVTFGMMVPLVNRAGLAGAAQAVFAGTLAVLPPFLYWVRVTTGVSIRRLMLALVPALGLTGAVALPAWLLMPLTGGESPRALVMIVLAMAGSYAAFSLLLWKMAASGPIRHLILVLARFKPGAGTLTRTVA